MNERNGEPIPKVAPPIPAPYLADVPQLPDELLAAIVRDERDPARGGRPLTTEQIDEADFLVGRLAKYIWLRRKEWEDQQGVEIDPEPKKMPLL